MLALKAVRHLCVCAGLVICTGARADVAPFSVLARHSVSVEASASAVASLSEADSYHGALTPAFDPALGTLLGLDFQAWAAGEVVVDLAGAALHPAHDVVTAFSVGVYTFEPMVAGGGQLIAERTEVWSTPLPGNVVGASFLMVVEPVLITPFIPVDAALFDRIMNPGFGHPPSVQIRLSLSMVVPGCTDASCALGSMAMRYESGEVRLDGHYVYATAVPEPSAALMLLSGLLAVAIRGGRGRAP